MFVKFLALLFCISVAQAGILDSIKDGVDNAANSATTLPPECLAAVTEIEDKIRVAEDFYIGKIVNITEKLVSTLKRDLQVLDKNLDEELGEVKGVLDEVRSGLIKDSTYLLTALTNFVNILEGTTPIDTISETAQELIDLLNTLVTDLPHLINALRGVEDKLGKCIGLPL